MYNSHRDENDKLIKFIEKLKIHEHILIKSSDENIIDENKKTNSVKVVRKCQNQQHERSKNYKFVKKIQKKSVNKRKSSIF